MDFLIQEFSGMDEYEQECKWLVGELYKGKYIQTLWNTDDADKRQNGWTLKGGVWSPWFFNMRPIGGSPRLFRRICLLMGEMIFYGCAEYKINHLIGVEMAGIPLASAAWMHCIKGGIYPKLGYTRPLPEKTRTLEETYLKYSEWKKSDPTGYGQKSWVEGRISDGDYMAIVDDMSSDLGSKLIARFMVLEEAKKLSCKVGCDHIFYFLNRNKDTPKKAMEFFAAEPQYYPHMLYVHYFLEFSDHLDALASEMREAEFRVISDYQENPGIFQDANVQKEVLSMIK